jgi:acid stress-induced BolA-like protein IbaG/YrbA
MTADQLKALISEGMACDHLECSGDGRHWSAVVVSPAFEGKRLIQRHQLVYGTLGQRIQNDEVHALSMKTYTPAEWASQGESGAIRGK